MNTSVRIVAALALLVAGQAMAASSLSYTLELGGDNNVAGWENGTYPAYTSTAGNDLDGQTYDVGDTINWAALVSVSGLHEDVGGLGDGLLPGGAANLVFDLQVTDGSGAVALSHATLVAGEPTTAGWYSSINDGDDDGARGLLDGADPELNAAFAMGFDVGTNGANGGRLFDSYANGGPYFDFYSYPSADGLPALAVVADGKLIGMGAGYSTFEPSFFGGDYTGGVGLTTASGDCEALGVMVLFEGQISTIGLDGGEYTLTLTPADGNNVLPGDSATNPVCSIGPNDRIAIAPNSVTGDTISFVLGGGPCTAPVVTAAESVKLHGATAYPIDVLTGGVTEGRDGGVTQLVVAFDQDIALAGGVDDVTVDSGTVSNLTVAGNQLTIDMSGATDEAVLNVGLAGVQDLTGGCSCADALAIPIKIGDTNNDNAVNIYDLLQIRLVLNQAASANPEADLTIDGTINIYDLLTVRLNLD